MTPSLIRLRVFHEVDVYIKRHLWKSELDFPTTVSWWFNPKKNEIMFSIMAPNFIRIEMKRTVFKKLVHPNTQVSVVIKIAERIKSKLTEWVNEWINLNAARVEEESYKATRRSKIDNNRQNKGRRSITTQATGTLPPDTYVDTFNALAMTSANTDVTIVPTTSDSTTGGTGTSLWTGGLDFGTFADDDDFDILN